MVNISNQNPQSTLSIKNKSIDGFTTSVLFTTLAGGLASQPTDYEQLQLKGTLKRNGQEIEMFNHTLKNLIILSHIKTPTYEFLSPGSFLLVGTAGGGVDSYIVPLRFDFGGTINLIGSDEFVLEWQLNPGFFIQGTNLNTSACYISLDETESSEVEYFVPITRSKVIEGSQDNPSYSLGDNVLNIILANYDKLDFDLSNRVVKTLRLKSDKITKNDTFDELLTKAVSYYPVAYSFGVRLQNWVIYQGADELDGVELNLSLNSANVTSSKNYVLWRTFYTDNWLVTRATALSEMAIAKSDKKGNFNSALLDQQLN